MGARCAPHGSRSCRRQLQLGWRIRRCGHARHEGNRVPGEPPPPPAPPDKGHWVLAQETRQAGANPLSACQRRVTPQSAAFMAVERPSQHAYAPEPHG